MPSRSSTSPIFTMGVRRSISAMTYRAISFVKAREQPPPTLMVKKPGAMPGGMEGTAQVAGGGLPARVGPQGVHSLLAVQSVAGSQGQQLHEARSLPQTPLVLPNRPRPHGYPEATEHPYPHILQTRRAAIRRRSVWMWSCLGTHLLVVRSLILAVA